MTREFAQSDITAFEPDTKVALVATVDPEGLPHISLITSLQAKSPTVLTFGQFCEGRSKTNVKRNPKTGFLIMNPERQLWRGKADWTHEEKSGDDFELYNQKPIFRYNAYFGIHTVHYLDLKEYDGQSSLPLPGMAAGTLISACTSRLVRARPVTKQVLKPWARAHVSKLTTLKFLAWIGDDGYPTIAPVVPTSAVDADRLFFAPTVSRKELLSLPKGTPIAVFVFSFQAESLLTRGRFAGFRRVFGMRVGIVDLDWAYNSMPPKQGQIYPEEPLEAVRVFE